MTSVTMFFKNNDVLIDSDAERNSDWHVDSVTHLVFPELQETTYLFHVTICSIVLLLVVS